MSLEMSRQNLRVLPFYSAVLPLLKHLIWSKQPRKLMIEVFSKYVAGGSPVGRVPRIYYDTYGLEVAEFDSIDSFL